MRIILIIFLFRKTNCQDGYSEQDILRYQQMAANDAQVETITGFNPNLGQRDTNSQGYNSGSQQYRVLEDSNKNEDYSRRDRSRSRKVYRIKNPFQQTEDTETPQDPPQDIETSASNQYAAMQYSLPPEQFLAQMKAEGQYQQQYSTPSPAPSYTATPQPQYQYSTLSVSGYDNGPQSNYNSRAETKTYASTYNNNPNNFQYNNNANLFNQDIVASTPLPSFLSTALPSNQYIGTPANSYLSSPSSVYVSSPQNIQQYVSSPVSFDYNNNRVSTIGSDSLGFHNNEVNKRMQIDHYDNSGNVIRYPNNIQSQYQSDFSSSTISPTSSYFDNKQDSWQNNGNSEINALSKSIQDNQAQYNNLRYNNIQAGSKQDSNIDNINSDTHRIGSMPAANNLYLNIVKPDYQVMNNLKHREQETGLTPVYSNGDYGWKLSDKKSNYPQEATTPSNNFRYQIHSLQPETGAFSQVSFQMDAGKEYSYDQTPKPSSEKIDAEEFAKAAAKAHENYKQQLKASSYASNSQYNSNYYANNPYLNSYFAHSNKQKQTYDDDSNQNTNLNSPSDLITASPFYYTSSRENIFDNKQKLPFDHDKALKNIVPIDVSNVVPHTNGLLRVNPLSDSKINIFNIGKDHSDLIQQSTPTNDAIYYKDKNSFYSINFKPKPEYMIEADRFKQPDSIASYYGKDQQIDSLYNNGGYSGNKRFLDNIQRNINANQLSIINQDNTVSSANIQQNLHRPTQQSDMSGFLKLNDIPHRLTEAYTAESLRFNNNFDQNVIPTPLPLRLNQNVDNHHIDVASEILNKLIANKAAAQNRPDVDSQSTNSLSTINGMKIANPYNVDLKLVADMLKGKSTIDESQMIHLRDQYDKPSLPLKLDISQLQQMNNYKNDNPLALSNALSVIANSYYDIYNGGRFPYQGVKYSRSEEEAENIPIADSSNNLAIGAVLDEDDSSNIPEETNITEQQEDITLHQDEDKSKPTLDTDIRILNDRKKHFNNPYAKRHSHARKYPKSEINEPYPLLKPPPLRQSRFGDKNRRRLHKHKVLRVFKTEPLFEANSLNVEDFNSKTHQHSLAFDGPNLNDEEKRT